ncbi:MAG: PadR family transcriptional regulator [Chloroflexi bacterium]|nr:PadR family transcriptional regulator [Chloroflexota bacterium]
MAISDIAPSRPQRPDWPARPVRSARDVLSLAVLAFLTEQPHHAYDMERMIRDRHKEFAAGKPRSLYHAVERLARSGLIEPAETTREGRRPERTVYRITEDGREQFAAWVSELLEQPQPEYPQVTVAVSFISYVEPARAVEALRSRIVHLEAEIAGIDAALRALHGEMHLPRLVLLEHECRRTLRQAECDWVRSLIEQIQSGQLHWSLDGWAELFNEHLTANHSIQEQQ